MCRVDLPKQRRGHGLALVQLPVIELVFPEALDVFLEVVEAVGLAELDLVLLPEVLDDFPVLRRLHDVQAGLRVVTHVDEFVLLLAFVERRAVLQTGSRLLLQNSKERFLVRDPVCELQGGLVFHY